MLRRSGIVIALWSGSCGGHPGAVDAAPDTPSLIDAAAGTCVDLAHIGPCTGSLSGDIMVPTFNCVVPSFASYSTGVTRLLLDTPTPPAGTTQINAQVDFVGAPGSTAMPTINSTATATVISTLAYYQATASPPVGTLVLSNITAVARMGGTPGDYCVHGKFVGMLPTSSGGSVMLTMNF
jgi:hypothetical protein